MTARLGSVTYLIFVSAQRTLLINQQTKRIEALKVVVADAQGKLARLQQCILWEICTHGLHLLGGGFRFQPCLERRGPQEQNVEPALHPVIRQDIINSFQTCIPSEHGLRGAGDGHARVRCARCLARLRGARGGVRGGQGAGKGRATALRAREGRGGDGGV